MSLTDKDIYTMATELSRLYCASEPSKFLQLYPSFSLLQGIVTQIDTQIKKTPSTSEGLFLFTLISLQPNNNDSSISTEGALKRDVKRRRVGNRKNHPTKNDNNNNNQRTAPLIEERKNFPLLRDIVGTIILHSIQMGEKPSSRLGLVCKDWNEAFWQQHQRVSSVLDLSRRCSAEFHAHSNDELSVVASVLRRYGTALKCVVVPPCYLCHPGIIEALLHCNPQLKELHTDLLSEISKQQLDPNDGNFDHNQITTRNAAALKGFLQLMKNPTITTLNLRKNSYTSKLPTIPPLPHVKVLSVLDPFPLEFLSFPQLEQLNCGTARIQHRPLLAKYGATLQTLKELAVDELAEMELLGDLPNLRTLTLRMPDATAIDNLLDAIQFENDVLWSHNSLQSLILIINDDIWNDCAALLPRLIVKMRRLLKLFPRLLRTTLMLGFGEWANCDVAVVISRLVRPNSLGTFEIATNLLEVAPYSEWKDDLDLPS